MKLMVITKGMCFVLTISFCALSASRIEIKCRYKK